MPVLCEKRVPPLCGETHKTQTEWLFFLQPPAPPALPSEGPAVRVALCSEVRAWLSDEHYTYDVFLHENQFRKLKVFGNQILFQYEFKICILKLRFHDTCRGPAAGLAGPRSPARAPPTREDGCTHRSSSPPPSHGRAELGASSC